MKHTPSKHSELAKLKEKTQSTSLVVANRAIQTIDQSFRFFTARDGNQPNEAMEVSRKSIRFGMFVFVAVFIFFGAWAAFAPLHSAAIAEGTVMLAGNRKTIQHLEGGIIEEILVREGDLVAAGQILMVLDETTAKANLELIVGQYLAAKATESRLVAERDNLETIGFDHEITDNASKPEIQTIIQSQQSLFESRKGAASGQVDILNQRIKQFDDEIRGLQSQESSTRSQLRLIKEEIDVVLKLLEKGQGTKPRLLALQRRDAELNGIQGEYIAQIAKARQAITEAQLEITNIRTKFLNEVVAELKETEVQLADLLERRKAAQDKLDRTVITAPSSGVITDLKFYTIGGVIGPGEKIVDIVPQDDKLVIEAHVALNDIDVVRPGQEARIRLRVYKTRKVPQVHGTVQQVSPDRFVNERTGQAFYKARILVDPKALEKLKDIELYPGMPTDVLIVTGSRTFLQYLIAPITDTLQHSFREQ